MKPHVFRQVWTYISLGGNARSTRWHVEFEDSCGCVQSEDFSTHGRALEFANRIAAGVDRWHA